MKKCLVIIIFLVSLTSFTKEAGISSKQYLLGTKTPDSILGIVDLPDNKLGTFIKTFTEEFIIDFNRQSSVVVGGTDEAVTKVTIKQILTSANICKIKELRDGLSIILGGGYLLYFIDKEGKEFVDSNFLSSFQVSDVIGGTSIDINKDNDILITFATKDQSNNKAKLHFYQIAVDLDQKTFTEKKSFTESFPLSQSNKEEIFYCIYFDNYLKVLCSYIDGNALKIRYLSEDLNSFGEMVLEAEKISGSNTQSTFTKTKIVKTKTNQAVVASLDETEYSIRLDFICLENGKSEVKTTKVSVNNISSLTYSVFYGADNNILYLNRWSKTSGSGLSLDVDQSVNIGLFEQTSQGDFKEITFSQTYKKTREIFFSFKNGKNRIFRINRGIRDDGTVNLSGFDLTEYIYELPECEDFTLFLKSGEEKDLPLSSLTKAEDKSLLTVSVSAIGSAVNKSISTNIKFVADESGKGNIDYYISYNTSIYSRLCRIELKICNEVCKSCSEYSSNMDDPKCNGCKEGYYPAEDNLNGCYKKGEKKGYFFEGDKLKKCYDTCSECNGKGSKNDHKCTTCNPGYTLVNNICICNENSFFYQKPDIDYQICVEECSTDFPFLYADSKQCLAVCPDNAKVFDNHCADSCPSGKEFFYKKDKLYYCTSSCPESHPYTNENSKECLEKCSDSLKIYQKTCVSSCPEGYKEGDNRICEEERYTSIDKVISNVDKKIVDLYKRRPSDSFGNSSYKIYPSNKTPDLSSRISIDAECIKELKAIYNVPDSDPVLIFVSDFKRENQISNQIEYAIYTMDGTKMDVKACKEKGMKTKVTSPLDLDEASNVNLTLAKEMLELGYDIFNPNDSFYTDICATYTTSNGTDMTLEDRKKNFYQNITFCEEGCQYESVDLEVKEVTCICNMKEDISEEEATFSVNTLGSQFTSITKQANIKIIKCYNKVFNWKNLETNYGSFLIFSLLALEISMKIYYFILGPTPLLSAIHRFLVKKQAEEIKNEKITEKEEKDEYDTVENETGRKKRFEISEDKRLYVNPSSNPPRRSNKNLIQAERKYPKEEKNNKPVIKYKLSSESLKSNNNFIYSNSEMQTSKFMKNETRIEDPKIKKSSSLDSLNEKDQSFKKLTDEELDEMNYEEALKNDDRSYARQFWSQFRYKQSIIFTFFVGSDLNLRPLKIILYILGLTLMIGFNALFYTDDTISRNYESGGKFEFVYSLPKTIIVNIVCDIIMFLIEFLSLTQEKVQEIRDTEEKKKAEELSRKFVKWLKCKIYFFLILSMVLNLLIWYYVAAFCAVYKNTQKHLLKDCLMSFIEEIILSCVFVVLIVTLKKIGLYCKLKYLYCMGTSVEKLHIFF